MSLISSSYFIRDIGIPNPTDSNITSFITKYEKEFLIRCFGYTLYKLINAYNAESPGDTTQRIRDIIEGKEFTEESGDTTFTYKWNGLINSDLESPIAYYVYYKFQRDALSETTITGEIKTDHELASNVDAPIKIMNAWNKMVDLIGNSDEYNEYSLRYFMIKYYDTYPEWEYKDFEYLNSFDL